MWLALQGSGFFAPQTVIDDCRDNLWTHSTVYSTTLYVFHTLTVSATVTQDATNTVTIPTTVTKTATTDSIVTITSNVTSTVLTTETITPTITTEIDTTATITTETTSTVTSSTSVTNTNIATSELSQTVTTVQSTLESTTLTLTETETVTKGIPIQSVTPTNLGAAVKKRQATTISLPTYASGICSDHMAYTSACTCIGITLGGTLYPRADVTQIPTTITTNVTVTATATHFATNVVTVEVTTTTTDVEDVTSTQNFQTTTTATATQFTTSTVLVTASITETISQGTTTTLTLQVTVTDTTTIQITDTLSVSTTSFSMILQTANSTSTSIVSMYTEFALRATNDGINQPFQGQYLYFYQDPNDSDVQYVKFTSDITLAMNYTADSNGNVTGANTEPGSPYTIPFGTFPLSTNDSKLYEMELQPDMDQVGCWLDSTLLLHCQGVNRTYLAAMNASSEINLFNNVGEIFSNSAVGPLILQAVPFPTADTPAPINVSRNIIINYVNSTTQPVQNAFRTQYLGSTTDSSGRTQLEMVTTEAAAKQFTVDPITGNIFDTVGRPFVFTNTGVQGDYIYSNFPNASDSATALVLPCRLNVTSTTNGTGVHCMTGNYTWTGIYAVGSAKQGFLSEWYSYDSMLNVAWVFYMEALFV
ncbi:hypothetical protein TWF694_001267 [Orbilia ellipsospora]|uniref:GLEYA adhesin domain-containing protein n=1 Tax=Orbilia ellipsospora TaxID=2528407 RepID=A0AAV9XRI6_9PEZI